MPFKTEQKKGLIHLESCHFVPQTMMRLEAVIKKHGLRIFACIDHSGAAAEVGLRMRPTQVLVFGNPQSGTPIMIDAPSLAIDLPFKVLVWEDDTGKVWLTYNAPEYLRNRHGAPESLVNNLSPLINLLRDVVK